MEDATINVAYPHWRRTGLIRGSEGRVLPDSRRKGAVRGFPFAREVAVEGKEGTADFARGHDAVGLLGLLGEDVEEDLEIAFADAIHGFSDGFEFGVSHRSFTADGFEDGGRQFGLMHEDEPAEALNKIA